MKDRDEGRVTGRAERAEGRPNDVRTRVHAQLEEHLIGGLSCLREPTDQLEAFDAVRPRQPAGAPIDALLESG